MKGSKYSRGKGAIWCNILDANLKSLSFTFSGNPEDSFVDNGVIFNVSESENTIHGYYVAMNYKYDTLYRAIGCTDYPTSRHFEISPGMEKKSDKPLRGYNPYDEIDEGYPYDMWGVSPPTQTFYNMISSGNYDYQNGDMLALFEFTYTLGNNRIPVEEINLVRMLGHKKMNQTASVKITVESEGYGIWIDGTKIYTIKTNTSNKNIFGFMSNHHIHSCQMSGYYTISNIITDVE